MSDQSDLEPFLDKDYRDAWLDIRVKAGIAYQTQAIRQAMGMSQAEFGALLAKPQSVVSRLEDNEYSGTIKTLLEIAKSLGVGLKVEFCSYPELLAADVSPGGLAVENIHASVARSSDQSQPHETAFPEPSATKPIMVRAARHKAKATSAPQTPPPSRKRSRAV